MAGSKSTRGLSGPKSRLRTIKRTQRSQEIRRQLEDAIKSGEFGPGERLPSERELVGTFGVSRVSVREAIRSLEAIGLVRVYQGRGAFVNDRRSGFGEPMARWLDLHRDEVIELLGVRGALDEYAAALAAESHDAVKMSAIEAAHRTLTTAVTHEASAEDLVALDIDFHVAIAEASGNRLLYDLLSDLHSYLAESRYLAFVAPGRAARSTAEHGDIVEAIVAGDASSARSATSRHIAQVRELLVAGMQADRERPRRARSSRIAQGQA